MNDASDPYGHHEILDRVYVPHHTAKLAHLRQQPPSPERDNEIAHSEGVLRDASLRAGRRASHS